MSKGIKYEVVREDGGGYSVKAEVDDEYPTSADCFCVDGYMNASVAIAAFLNGSNGASPFRNHPIDPIFTRR